MEDDPDSAFSCEAPVSLLWNMKEQVLKVLMVEMMEMMVQVEGEHLTWPWGPVMVLV